MKAKKRPIVIDYFPCVPQYFDEIMKWSTKKRPIRIIRQKKSPKASLSIHTLEGLMMATEKDVIIRGINGEAYPCKLDIFKKTYQFKSITK